MEILERISEINLQGTSTIEVLGDIQNQQLTYHDILLVLYRDGNEMFPLGTGNVISVFDELFNAITSLLNHDNTMKVDFDFEFDRGIGFYYNLKYNDAEFARKLLRNKNFFLYGGNAGSENNFLCTIYEYKAVVYIEVSTLFVGEEEAEFHEWLNKDYTILARKELSLEKCIDIQKECKRILSNIEDFEWGGNNG
jgi:hypothetical protein